MQYKLLLYLSQQKQVTAAKIHVGFVFTVSRGVKDAEYMWTNRKSQFTLRGVYIWLGLTDS